MSKVAAALTQAAAYPSEVRFQIKAAYACFEAEDYEKACTYFYDALSLGLPIDGKLEFYTKFGIALRLVKNLEDSEQVLLEAIKTHPYDKILPVFLAFTLRDQGRHDEAIAKLLEVLVSVRDAIPDVGQNQHWIKAFIADILPNG